MLGGESGESEGEELGELGTGERGGPPGGGRGLPLAGDRVDVCLDVLRKLAFAALVLQRLEGEGREERRGVRVRFVHSGVADVACAGVAATWASSIEVLEVRCLTCRSFSGTDSGAASAVDAAFRWREPQPQGIAEGRMWGQHQHRDTRPCISLVCLCGGGERCRTPQVSSVVSEGGWMESRGPQPTGSMRRDGRGHTHL